ncbi:hypothetical protein SBOR_5469 [Sclerotinia borealis F-4128]|uniref:Uncharacterized protein n=1 Tax=Sclerotinia borealis (strain F-4128) TaxID=1432307 RepID=W9CE66_SCLBF|nr:hypothetical protein SBOR_5469 [Sclerotinia borealis F-4128]
MPPHSEKQPITLSPICTTPPLLHTCSLSRSLLLPHYELVSSGRGGYTPEYNDPVNPDDDSRKTFYLNPEVDVLYFTSLRVFDSEQNQHFPCPHTCAICVNVTFDLHRALRVVVGNRDVRVRLRNVAVGLEIPGLRPYRLLVSGADADLKGLMRLFWVMRDDAVIDGGAISREIGEGEVLGRAVDDRWAGKGKIIGKTEIPQLIEDGRKILDGRTHVDLSKDLRMWKMEDLVNDYYARKCLERNQSVGSNVARLFKIPIGRCSVPSSTQDVNEERKLEFVEVSCVVVGNV